MAVTDVKWYTFLQSKPGLALVNFWKPSGASFHTLEEGEYFFFKAKAPINRIVGGGIYGGYAISRLYEAWAMFGEAKRGSEPRRVAGTYQERAVLTNRVYVRAQSGVLPG